MKKVILFIGFIMAAFSCHLCNNSNSKEVINLTGLNKPIDCSIVIDTVDAFTKDKIKQTSSSFLLHFRPQNEPRDKYCDWVSAHISGIKSNDKIGLGFEWWIADLDYSNISRSMTTNNLIQFKFDNGEIFDLNFKDATIGEYNSVLGIYVHKKIIELNNGQINKLLHNKISLIRMHMDNFNFDCAPTDSEIIKNKLICLLM
jgi:hypothetical protein